jgi:hypothetical protein
LLLEISACVLSVAAFDINRSSNHSQSVTRPHSQSRQGAFTAGERQRRRRKKLRQARSAELNRMHARKARDEEAKQYIPSPPGITYWRKVTLQNGERICS